MFEIYQDNEFVLYYTNENNSTGFTHLLRVKNFSTGKTTGIWVDPSHTSTDSKLLDKILRLKDIKNNSDEDTYRHEVACFIETLIKNTGYTCLEISSLAKSVLKHHKNPQQLLETINNIDLSYLRAKDKEHFQSVQEMKIAVAGFVKVLAEFICNLLGIASKATVSAAFLKLNFFQNSQDDINETILPNSTQEYNHQETPY
ncbi:hypothetical protein [Legionella waltersii]|uniref:Uncharacterized protein n=1 Tax=Legionella waltersii TaxID=66969 RepID=A0A0W1ALP4_9GAMM|nr:hypothetical protein [Legionella waltersii]KTD82176.1 hypothetical protein Lwal_0653 [Legionella waltersii]SNV10504.1 Uncharacterised protein [Legionella waltersii]